MVRVREVPGRSASRQRLAKRDSYDPAGENSETRRNQASEKMPKAARKLRRPQTIKLQEKPPISDSTEAVRPEETEGQSAPPVTLRLRTRYSEAPPPGIFHAEIGHRWTQSNAGQLRISLDSICIGLSGYPECQQGLDSEGFRSAPRTG
jgi:hypothetical protein